MPNTELKKIITSATKSINAAYVSASRELSRALIKNGAAKITNPVKFKASIEKILAGMNKDVQTIINGSAYKAWGASNVQFTDVITKYAKKAEVSVISSWLQSNDDAFQAFTARTVNGLQLSERVWKMTKGAQAILEETIGSGILTGQSAAEISKATRQALIEPNKLFRRVRDAKTGKLVLSKPAAAYHPGRGVYRSSYKNTRRLAATETNMAYRTSEYIRRQQLPFIIGYDVHLSSAHPLTDICDDMIGRYPKTFHFMGWHPHCLCYTTAVMAPVDKFKQYMKTGKGLKYMNKLPGNAIQYINKNAGAIKSQQPYWATQNFDKDLKPRFVTPQYPEDIEPVAVKKTPAAKVPANKAVKDWEPMAELKPKTIDQLEAEQQKWWNNASSLERTTLKNYTSSRYRPMNKTLVSSLEKLPKYKGTVYRGMSSGSPDKMIKVIKEKSIFTDKGFITSFNKTVAFKDFSRDIGVNAYFEFTIKSKNGRAVWDLSKVQKKKEVLFTPMSSFKVESYTVSERFGKPLYKVNLTEIIE